MQKLTDAERDRVDTARYYSGKYPSDTAWEVAGQLVAIIDRLTQDGPATGSGVTAERMFPIMDAEDIPWSLIQGHEKQAQTNHSQSLARLAERGGLGAAEAVAILEDRRFTRMDDAQARARLKALTAKPAEIDRAKLAEWFASLSIMKRTYGMDASRRINSLECADALIAALPKLRGQA